MAYDYGELNFGEGFYGGRDGIFSPIASQVEIYDSLGAFKAGYQTGTGDFLGCEFTLDEGGCREFILYFAIFVDIEKKDIVKIRLFDSDDTFFTGVVRFVPIEGSTKQEYNYGGFGLNDYLVRANTESQSYLNKTINEIVIDLLDNIILPKTPINKNLAKISPLATTITEINFNYISCKEALEQLKKIANADGNDYLVGVDRVGDFIFIARDTDIKATLTVGKDDKYGIQSYEPEDTYEAISKLFVLDKDGTFWDSYQTLEDIDVFEKKLTAPDIADADIDNWAEGQLKELEIETREANITWEIETQQPVVLDANGYLRIISNIPPTVKDVTGGSKYGSGKYGSGLYGGSLYTGYDIDDTLKVKEVKYIVNDQSAIRNIQLGSIPVELDREIIEVNKNVESLRVSLGR